MADFQNKSNFKSNTSVWNLAKSMSWAQISIKSNIKLNTLMSPRQFLESFFRANSDIQAKFQNPTTTPSGRRPVQR